MLRVFSCRKAFSLLTSSLLILSTLAQDKAGLHPEIDYTEDAIIFENIDFASTLTIKGPFWFEKQIHFDVDETPFIDARNEHGEFLPDGLYKYELLSIPRVNQETSEIMANGDDRDRIASLLTKGNLISGTFRILEGILIDPEMPELKAITRNKNDHPNTGGGTPIGGNGGIIISQSPITDSDGGLRDFLINDDLIVDGSGCIGFGCVNGEIFGTDTLRLKEQTLRIKFDDTSTLAGYPNVDWQLTANDSASGGANKFSIDDTSNGRTPFTIEANAQNHALFVDNGGFVGLGTSIPTEELHMVSGNSPTMRLEQNNSSGFTPQIWDVAANEVNFFIRDVTHANALPFRIKPGAPSDALYIGADGNVGFGDATPAARIDVNGNAQVQGRLTSTSSTGNSGLQITETMAGAATPIRTTNNGAVTWRMDNSASGGRSWALTMKANNQFTINETSTSEELTINPGGNVTIGGTLTESSSRHLKHDFEAVDQEDVLARLSGIPVNHWRYNHTAGVKHMGVMAQDFYAAFGLGANECGISSVDTSGVAFASIQALNQKVIQQETEAMARNAEIQSLKERLAKLEKLLSEK